jgi:hypothetical protein
MTDAGTKKRLLPPTRGVSPQQLKVMAQRLKTTQARALQLAIQVMSGLAARIEQGSTVIVRDRDGKETTMWLPELDQMQDQLRAEKHGIEATNHEKTPV